MPKDELNPLDLALCQWLDREVDKLDMDDPELSFSTTGFNWWLANNGFPKSANELRRMFEFAARMEGVWTEFLRRRGIRV